MNITFIGMPGSGKSTIGEWVARDTGMQFIDWIKTHDIGAAKEVCTYWDEFLKAKMTG